jgi:vanillate O-demethylase monooxygenase subunit
MMFLRNCWYVAGWSHHIAADSLVSRTMLGEPIVLYRKADGGVAALEDRCCHRLAPLSRGRIDGDDLRCMYHGLKFAPSGKCVEVPGQDLIPSTAMVRSYPVVEQDCWVWLWMGDPALADPALIPAALGHADPDWLMQTGQLAYEANYELINDYLGLPAEARTDMWASYDYLVPGVFLLATQSHPPGTAAACKMETPSAEPVWRSLTSQAVTPISERQTIYYYSGCLSRSYTTEEQSRQQIAVFEKAFAEDKAMIEAQQRVVDRTPERRMMVLSTDGALKQFRRLMTGLIEAEQQPRSPAGERRFA